MYSVFLVDDEYLELKTLHQYIDWQSMGFYIAGTAENGRAAMTAVEEIRPDVVITDIRMPAMDGIGLAEAIHAKFPQTVIVFLSGYNEFEYAKSALKVEAAGYLLKPLDIEELTEMMTLVREKCDNNLLYRKTALSIASDYLEESFFHPDPDNWRQNFRTLSRMLNGCFGLERDNTSYYIGMITIDEYLRLMKTTQENIHFLDTIRENILSLLKTNKLVWFCRGSYYYIVSGNPIYPVLALQCSQGMLRSWITYNHTDTAVRLEDLKEAFLALQTTGKNAPSSVCTQKYLIKEVISLLQTDYYKCMSIDDVASQVHLSPNYLSSLFKDATGQTVLEYLTGIRLEKAALLLQSTAGRIYEIAKQVGYENPSYFCMLFQKKFNVTPKQFRQKIKESM